MTLLPTAAAFLAHARRNVPLARLYVVTAASVRFVDAAQGRAWLGDGKLFHGELLGEMVRRLPSEGGGCCAASAVREVV